MASLDLARDWMAREGADWYRKAVEGVDTLREHFPSLLRHMDKRRVRV